MVSNNDIVALRELLFETMRGLSNKESPLEIDRAKAIGDMAQVIINSAKVEVDALRVIGGTGSGFIPALPKIIPAFRQEPDQISKKIPDTRHSPTGITVHKMKG